MLDVGGGGGRSLAEGYSLTLAYFRSQGIAGLLGVTQKHGGVGLVEDWVIHSGVAHS